MKIIKSILNFTEPRLFKNNGDVVLTNDTAYLMDCILTVFAADVEIKTLHMLNLEMHRCGIYITYPDLKKVMKYLVKEGLFSYTEFSEFSQN